MLKIYEENIMQSISGPCKKHYTKIRNVERKGCEFQSLHWNTAGHLEKENGNKRLSN